jgi:AraC-like DNA-binding protein
MDPRAALRSAGIDIKLLSFNDGQVSFSAVDTLLNQLAVTLKSDGFGLRAAEAWRVSDLRSLGLLLQHLPTLRDVLTATAVHGLRFQTAFTGQFSEAGEHFRVQIEARPAAEGRHVVEYFLGTMIRTTQSVMGDRWLPVSVHTGYPQFEDRAAERRLFGDRMRFNSAFTGMIGDRRDLDLPLRHHEPEFERQVLLLLEQHPPLDGGDVVQQVKDQIRFLMAQNAATLPLIADFTELLNGVRRDVAVKSLTNRNISISQITASLGYSDASTFGRWFKSQFHVAPAHWRDQRSGLPLGAEPTH